MSRLRQLSRSSRVKGASRRTLWWAKTTCPRRSEEICRPSRCGPEVELAQGGGHPLRRVRPGRRPALAISSEARCTSVAKTRKLGRRLARPEGLGHQHRQAVGLLAGGAAGHPDAHLLGRRDRRRPARASISVRSFSKASCVAQEAGDPDEQVAVERAQLAGIGGDPVQVLLEVAGVGEQQAPLDAPPHGAAPCSRRSRCPTPAAAARRCASGRPGRRRCPSPAAGRRAPGSGPAPRPSTRAAAPGPPRRCRSRCGACRRTSPMSSWAMTRPPASWMARIPREPSLPVPERTMPTPRSPASSGQRREEGVDGQEQPLGRVPFGQAAAGPPEMIISCSGRHQVDVVRLDHHPLLGPRDRQRGVRRQQLAHDALEVGRQVLDHHEGQPSGGPGGGEQPLQGFEATRRGAHPHDEEASIIILASCRVHGRLLLGAVLGVGRLVCFPELGSLPRAGKGCPRRDRDPCSRVDRRGTPGSRASLAPIAGRVRGWVRRRPRMAREGSRTRAPCLRRTSFAPGVGAGRSGAVGASNRAES